jgi:hypothetical protein
MIFSGCFRRTKTHNPFKHDRFVILVRTPRTYLGTTRTNERTRTSEGRRTGGKPRDRVGARARFPRALLRSFVRFRSFDFVAFDFVASVGGVPSVRAIRSGEKVDSTSTKGPSTRGFFAVRCGTDGWMDAVTDGRRATRRRRRATRARTMRKRRIPRGPAAATGDRGGGDRRRAMARGVERWRATNQPPVRVVCRVCVSCMSSRDS